MQNVGSSIGGLQGGLSYLTPPSGSPIPRAPFPPIPGGGALGVLGAIAGALSLIGALGGNKFRDDQLAKLGKSYDQGTGLSSNQLINPNTGFRDNSDLSNTSGVAGVAYSLFLSYKVFRYGSFISSVQDNGPFGLVGPFSLRGPEQLPAGNGWIIVVKSGNGQYQIPLVNGAGTEIQDYAPRIIDSNQQPYIAIPSPSGYTGDNGESPAEKGKKLLPPGLSSGIGWGSGNPAKLPPAAAGLGKGVSPSDLLPSPTGTPLKNPDPNPPAQPPSPIKPPVPPIKDPNKEKKAPPSTPPLTDLGNINQNIVALLAQAGLIYGNTNQIKANTSFDNLKNAAAQGACQSLQSPSCTQSLKDDIKNPIDAKLDAAQIARDTNAAAQTAALTDIATEQQVQKGVLASILAKAREIFDLVGGLWNNGLIDKAMQYITMITVIHNAAMLSRGIADTLGSALDSGLQALGLQIKDKDGNVQGVAAIVGKSFADLIKGIIGADNYAALTQTWAQANRIYQSGINLLSNVQNILDSTTAVAELTSNRVGTLMNALRNVGGVRENAYGAQSQNVTRFNAFMNKLEALEQGTSNFASITGNIVSVQQSVNELKSNRTEFENAINDKNTIEETAKTEKREESVFKIADFTIVRPPEQS